LGRNPFLKEQEVNFYIIRRLIYILIILLVVSVVAFTIIQLPPGDYLSTYIHQLESSGLTFDQNQLALLRKQYGLDLPIYLQYFKWMRKMLQGDFGKSFTYKLTNI